MPIMQNGAHGKRMQEQNKFNTTARDSQAEAFEQQLEARIAAMEQAGYQFPVRFSRKDYISVAIAAAACLILIIIGGAL